jgi:predicted transposase/invertase (TIGR01784 family)
MDIKLFPLTNDYVFKSVFVKDPRLLVSLLNAILFLDGNREIEEVEILNPELPKDSHDEKNSILDMKAKDKGGRHFHVEMQAGLQGIFIKRSLYYLAGMIRDQLKASDEYSILEPIYQVNILDFNLLATENYLNRFTLREEMNPKLELTQDLVVVFLELPKFLKNIHDLESKLDCWLYSLKNTSQMKREEINMVVDKTPDMNNLFKILEYYSSNSEEKRRLEEKIKKDRDYAYELVFHFERGMSEGIAKGIDEGMDRGSHKVRLETAKKMIEKGLSISDIQEITGLSKEELYSL